MQKCLCTRVQHICTHCDYDLVRYTYLDLDKLRKTGVRHGLVHCTSNNIQS